MKEWNDLPFWGSETWKNLRATVVQDKHTTPSKGDIFKALRITPKEQVKVVILGQDPYPTKGDADGLAFSVAKTAPRLPPSLRNIFAELVSDVGCALPTHGDLSSWAEQGVLLLNTCLTTRVGSPGAHRGLGWEQLAEQTIQALRDNEVVFVLWGKDAQNTYDAVCGPHQLQRYVISSAHPSPYSAHLGFFGHRPFSRTNTFLGEFGKEPIQWAIGGGTSS